MCVGMHIAGCGLAVGESTSVAAESVIAGMPHQKTQMAMLRDDAQVVVQGTIEQLNQAKRDAGKAARSMLKQMHAALWQDLISWSTLEHKRKRSKQAKDAAPAHKMPRRKNIRKQFKAWAKEVDALFNCALIKWNELEEPFPAHTLDRKHMVALLKRTAPDVYNMYEPLACQQEFPGAVGEKRPAEVEQRMALATDSLMHTMRIHSQRRANGWALFQGLALIAHKAGGTYHAHMAADRRALSAPKCRQFLCERVPRLAVQLKDFFRAAVSKRHILFFFLDNAFLSDKMRWGREDRQEGKQYGKDFTVCGFLRAYDQYLI